MRHFLLPGPVAALAFGVGVTTAQAGLIAATGGTNGATASLIGTRRGAVAMATVTVAADQYSGAATSAQVASSGEVHWQSGPMGDRRRRPLREILCRQRRRCWAAGRGIGSGLAVGTGVAPAFPPAGLLSTASALTALPPAALRLPDNDCCAIRPPEALRAANRKTSIDTPERQKQTYAHISVRLWTPDFYGSWTPLTTTLGFSPESNGKLIF